MSLVRGRCSSGAHCARVFFCLVVGPSGRRRPPPVPAKWGPAGRATPTSWPGVWRPTAWRGPWSTASGRTWCCSSCTSVCEPLTWRSVCGPELQEGQVWCNGGAILLVENFTDLPSMQQGSPPNQIPNIFCAITKPSSAC